MKNQSNIDISCSHSMYDITVIIIMNFIYFYYWFTGCIMHSHSFSFLHFSKHWNSLTKFTVIISGISYNILCLLYKCFTQNWMINLNFRMDGNEFGNQLNINFIKVLQWFAVNLICCSLISANELIGLNVFNQIN